MENSEAFWSLFESTGSPAAYLLYRDELSPVPGADPTPE